MGLNLPQLFLILSFLKHSCLRASERRLACFSQGWLCWEKWGPGSMLPGQGGLPSPWGLGKQLTSSQSEKRQLSWLFLLFYFVSSIIKKIDNRENQRKKKPHSTQFHQPITTAITILIYFLSAFLSMCKKLILTQLFFMCISFIFLIFTQHW